jgi:hypothetical protein
MELYHILYPVQKSEIFFKTIVCPIKMLPSPQKFSISIKKKKKKKQFACSPLLPYIFNGTAVEEWDMFVVLNIFFPPKHKLIFHKSIIT